MGIRRLFRTVAFSPDGKTLASGSYDATIRLRDVNTHKATTLEGDKYGVYCLAYSPGRQDTRQRRHRFDSARLGSENKQNRLQTYAEHQNTVMCIAYSPDGKMIVSGDLDGTVHLWKVGAGETIHRWSFEAEDENEKNSSSHRIQAIAYSPDGKTIAASRGIWRSVIHLWDAETGELKRTFEEHRFDVNAVQFSPDGKFIASAGGRQRHSNMGRRH